MTNTKLQSGYRYVILYGNLYRLSEEKFQLIIRCLINGSSFNLMEIGTHITQVEHGKLLDISTMTAQEAQSYLR